jgi:hypothetical protein
VKQRRVLNDQGVGLGDRLADPDRTLVDPAERDKRCAGALGAEGGEGLGVLSLLEGESISAAVTTPWPLRPWIRTRTI